MRTGARQWLAVLQLACAAACLSPPDHIPAPCLLPPSVEYGAFRPVCARIASDPEVFRKFRNVAEFTNVVEDRGSPEATLEYIRRAMPSLLDFAHLFATSDQVGLPAQLQTGQLTRQTAMHVADLGDAVRLGLLHGGSAEDILEIGGGYGGFAKIVQDVLPIRSFTIVDLPEVAAVAARFLAAFPVAASRVVMIATPTSVEAMREWSRNANLQQRYSFCMSSYAYSELALEWRRLFFRELIARCERGLVIDNSLLIDPPPPTGHLLGDSFAAALRLQRHGDRAAAREVRMTPLCAPTGDMKRCEYEGEEKVLKITWKPLVALARGVW